MKLQDELDEIVRETSLTEKGLEQIQSKEIDTIEQENVFIRDKAFIKKTRVDLLLLQKTTDE